MVSLALEKESSKLSLELGKEEGDSSLRELNFGSTSGEEPVCHCRGIREVGSIPGLARSLEEKMAAYASIPTWRISWTEETVGLQTTGSQRVRHD